MAEEEGGVRAFHSFSAAKRAIGSRAGHQLHHIVEQCQGDRRQQAGRSGFSEERINTTDNFVWVPNDVHAEVSKKYSRIDLASDMILRDSLNGVSWDGQYRRGLRELNTAWRKVRGNDWDG